MAIASWKHVFHFLAYQAEKACLPSWMIRTLRKCCEWWRGRHNVDRPLRQVLNTSQNRITSGGCSQLVPALLVNPPNMTTDHPVMAPIL